MQIHVAALTDIHAGELPIETVERKGTGHPDTLCDALAENFSVALSRHYMERFGAILHHNVDKGLLFGGASRPVFGGGEIVKPIEIYLTGLATTEFRGVKVPVEEIAVESSLAWLRAHTRFLNTDRDVRIIPRIRSTPQGVANRFVRQWEAGRPIANDTSSGVGFAPLDELEGIVLAVERRLNAPAVKRAHPAIGEDIKVMGVRNHGQIALTVACALVDRHIEDLADYETTRAVVQMIARDAAQSLTDHAVEVQVNAADTQTPDSINLTVSGLTAEAGHGGQVGRGNRVNGLITPFRPMTLEASAGKNPVTHVGKLYSIVAQRIARALVAEVDGVEESHCYLISCTGQPIDEPQLFEVDVRLDDASALEALRPRIDEVASDELSRIGDIWRDAIEDRLQVW